MHCILDSLCQRWWSILKHGARGREGGGGASSFSQLHTVLKFPNVLRCTFAQVTNFVAMSTVFNVSIIDLQYDNAGGGSCLDHPASWCF